MYMLTSSNKTNVPLIKLTEGYSIDDNSKYVTLVTGSNGEPLKPVKVWDKPFIFFGKEALNAEFVSKTELIYIKATFKDEFAKIELFKYRVPDNIIDNTHLDCEFIKKQKPVVEQMFTISLPIYGDFTPFEELLAGIYGGVFRIPIILILYGKIKNPDRLYYYK